MSRNGRFHLNCKYLTADVKPRAKCIQIKQNIIKVGVVGQFVQLQNAYVAFSLTLFIKSLSTSVTTLTIVQAEVLDKKVVSWLTRMTFGFSVEKQELATRATQKTLSLPRYHSLVEILSSDPQSELLVGADLLMGKLREKYGFI
ncbi:hypothetical protein FQR65_LT18979 [Abscondita terminalis]|nr:hypothetical protein FQR65_LT18979 [Abscondita terminalis]